MRTAPAATAPSVVVLAGRRIDAPDAAQPRFPASNERLVRERVRKALQQSRPRALVCAAACGADLVALDEAGKLGIARHIVLPAPRAQFRLHSVVDRPGSWGPLFDRIVDEVAKQGTLLEHDFGSDDAAYRQANVAIFAAAEQVAAGAALQAWLIWNGAARGPDDITLHFADEAWSRSIPLQEVLTLPGRKASADAPEHTCFVAMPFRTKLVGERPVNFDAIYSTLIAPAIESVQLPEGGSLRAYRTDQDPTSGVIDEAMHRALTQSRLVVADATGQNANVMYELGVRHAVRTSGTVVFRQEGTGMPFDISHVKVFDYDPGTPALSRATIATVVRESLVQNTLDSPVRLALQQLRLPAVETLLHDAENALRNQDSGSARTKYAEALKLAPGDATILLRLAVLENRAGRWADGLAHARKASEILPNYGEAWRERGIAENQLWRKHGGTNDGRESLRRAVKLNPSDFDAFASLGGALWRAENWPEALEMYRESLAVSAGHPYPLLMVMKLEARVEGRLHVEQHRAALQRAAAIREDHTRAIPKYDPPWSYFDLIEIYLYLGRSAEALGLLPTALAHAQNADQIESFREALRILQQTGIAVEGLEAVLSQIDREYGERKSLAAARPSI